MRSGRLAVGIRGHAIATEAWGIRAYSLAIAKEQVLNECGNPKHEKQDYKTPVQAHPLHHRSAASHHFVQHQRFSL
jgi:hypothetical protein